MTKLSIRAGDKVRVIAGKDKGKEAKVLAAVPYKQRVIVERINMVKKATRPTQRNQQGRHPRDRGSDPREQRDARVPQLLAAHARGSQARRGHPGADLQEVRQRHRQVVDSTTAPRAKRGGAGSAILH